MKLAVFYDSPPGNKSKDSYIFEFLLLVCASTDFDKIFSVYITDINLQHVFSTFLLQIQIKRL